MFCKQASDPRVRAHNISLIAAAEVLQRKTVVISSIPGEKYILEIPFDSQEEPLILCHWGYDRYAAVKYFTTQ
jgi:hypothetical protein